MFVSKFCYLIVYCIYMNVLRSYRYKLCMFAKSLPTISSFDLIFLNNFKQK